ncbi:hypothetical protein FPOAC2_06761 [Fusarium poae]|uniref:hypothetical protein n=1 Tax=Fusarium poae TaxID=36050 RepID=UPI001CEA5681|nr:hypothetical protein FPOAC1_006629 [Fusarium poae]KAG8673318.1 hypothetical protein FPOAC1_006629 [Fusarium poae]
MTSIPKSVPGNDPSVLQNTQSNPPSRYPPPRKEAIQGSYAYIQYRPAWTDPDWQDEGLERERTNKDKNVFEIHDPIFDRLRPALLPRDAFRNPTIYAERFSMFPGRTDGRSRTSPTRADSRKLFPADTNIQTGKQLFDRFEELARDAGQHVDDYMDVTRPDLKNLSATEQQYMQQYEDLIIDENWQNILFGSLTMDEILAEGYLTMCDTELNELSGPLYELFGRDFWVDCRTLGDSEQNPRYMYTLNGQREEWDPRNNDRVWNAMQPALQLATRLLLNSEGFVDGLQDITNRFWVEDHLFADLAGQDRTRKLKFMRDTDTGGPRKVNGAQDIKDSGLDVLELSFRALRRIIELKLSSGFDMGNRPTRLLTMGQQNAPNFFGENSKIAIDIDSELVWPLLVDKYTKSEKLMANVILATTIAHEMMHAFCSSPFSWLGNPDSFGITDAGLIMACQSLDLELTDFVQFDRCNEPYFENDIYNEVGHAFEENVLSCGYWPFVFGTTNANRPPLLQASGGLMSAIVHSEGYANEAPCLKEPLNQFVTLNHLVRFEDVKKFFSQSFWDVAINKYGPVALREPSKKPHKFNFYPADKEYGGFVITQLPSISADDAQWLKNFRNDLINRNYYVLWNYLHNIIFEEAQYDLMELRLGQAIARWDNVSPWIKLGKEVHMIICEYLSHFCQTRLPQHDSHLLKSLYMAWDSKREALGSAPNWESNHLYQNSASFPDREERWHRMLQSWDIEDFEMRLVPKLIEFTKAVGRELGQHESLICELYQCGSQLWQRWISENPFEFRSWRLHLEELKYIFGGIIESMQLVDEGMKALDGGDWAQRICTLAQRVEDLITLMSFSPTQYDWRDLMWTMPMIRKSRRLPHQRYYFLAKKEMMKMTGKDLADLLHFKKRFRVPLSLGTHKIPLPGTNPDELSIAQRLSGTLDDDRGQTARDQQIKGPSTGVFDTDAVKNLVSQLNQKEKEAQEAKINRIAVQQQGKTGFQTLQQDAAAQAYCLPSIQPKFQQMGVHNQPSPFSEFKPFNGSNGPFSAYKTTTFPTHQPDQPPAWKANSAIDLAVWANQPLNGASPTAHGIMSHPYAVRATVTADLQNMAGFSLPRRDPSTFASHFPRESAAPSETPLGAGVLGDMDNRFNEESDPDVEMGDAEMGGHAGRATAVLESDYSSSDAETSEDEESFTREGSDTTLSWSSDNESDKASTGSDELPLSKKGEKRPSLKRKSSWSAVDIKTKRVGVSVTKRRSPKVGQKKATDYRKPTGGSLGWRKILSGLSGA